ncbi:MAG: ABC transporter ATP-binding protein [Chlorobi bacterium]|nr:ABC transporter ATP-binding protein [Chlorobiota bacterium]
MRAVLQLSGVSKKFGDIEANRDVSLSVAKGTIHAVVGENGAGKSTLAAIIYGMHRPDCGTMTVNGVPVQFDSPRDAIAAGIGMVHQHFMLVHPMTVTENIMLGCEQKGLFARLPLKAASEHVRRLSRQYGMEVEADARVETLSVGEEQRVEILKVLYRKASILILDEPTAVLTPQETVRLFGVLRSLRKEGKTILIITHKLDEVLDLAEFVTVMKKGGISGTVSCSQTSKQELARMMVGRDVLLRVENPPPSAGKTVLSVENLGYRNAKGLLKLDGTSFSVRSGEIFGIAGVEGNGQSELLSLLWGMHDRKGAVSGKIVLDGIDITGMTPASICALGVSHIPEDRLKHAVVASHSVSENLLFGRHREPRFHRGPGFDRQAVADYARNLAGRYDIRCSDPERQPLRSLSGGNQQKVVVGRELDRPGMKLLILAQPTRGVDIGAIEFIHKSIIEARDNGAAILLVSSELDELIALSSRIGCLYKGSMRRIFTETEVSGGRTEELLFKQEIGLHIT